MTWGSSCPDLACLRDYLREALPQREQDRVLGHLDTCHACQETLEHLAAGGERLLRTARQVGREPVGVAPILRQVLGEAIEADGLNATAPELHTAEAASLDFLSPAEEPGRRGRLGGYEVLEILGRGGMGVVLKALDAALHRVVAIKVMAPQLATSDGARRRFLREAQAAASVRNEHVIDIHAVGEANGLPHLVMEYVAGETLQARLDRTGPLDLRDVVRIGTQAAQGLAAAHAQGLIHRDIKPANILLEHDTGRVKITDFGLARAVDDGSLSQSEVIAGTPRYMAPEQARGEPVDHRADVYALGATLYELLTGRAAFDSGDVRAVLRQIAVDEPRPPRRLNRAVPVEVETIVLKAMAKEAKERYATAQELADDLQRFLKDEPLKARRPTALQRMRKWARRHQPAVWSAACSAVGLLLVVGVGLAVNNALLSRERDRAEAARQEAVAHLQTARRAIDQMLTRVASDLTFVPQMEQVQRDLLQDAVRFYEELLRVKSDDPALRKETGLALGGLGRVYARLGQHAAAEPALRQGIAMLEDLSAEGVLDLEGRKELTKFWTNLGWMLHPLGRRAEAEEAHRRALREAERLAAEAPDRYRNDVADACVNVGNSCRSGRPGEAEALYVRAITLSTLPGGSLHHLGRAYIGLGELLADGGRLEQADEAFGQAQTALDGYVREFPAMWQGRDRLADAHGHRGRVLAALGRPAEAEQTFRQAVALREKVRADYPSAPQYRDWLIISYADLALLLAATGRAPAAEEVCRKLEPLEPESSRACRALAWLLAACPEPRFRDPPRAVALAAKAVARVPSDGASWRVLGVARYRAGDGRGALAALEKSIQLFADRPEPARRGGLDAIFLAMAHWQLGEREEARRWYDRAVGWTEQHRPRDEELRRFRAEAAALLGVQEKKE
jgi:tetratricopeptide (TPR) repeat protein